MFIRNPSIYEKLLILFSHWMFNTEFNKIDLWYSQRPPASVKVKNFGDNFYATAQLFSNLVPLSWNICGELEF